MAIFTAGARKDFRGPFAVLGPLRSLTFIAAESIANRGVERHEGKVDRVIYYRAVPETEPAFFLIHMTADGHITDLDLVGD